MALTRFITEFTLRSVRDEPGYDLFAGVTRPFDSDTTTTSAS
jgi:hypothetical protein